MASLIRATELSAEAVPAANAYRIEEFDRALELAEQRGRIPPLLAEKYDQPHPGFDVDLQPLEVANGGLHKTGEAWELPGAVSNVVWGDVPVLHQGAS